MNRPRAGPPNHSLGAIGAGVVVLIFCLLLLRHDPQFFWTDDYQISVLPVFTDVARSWSEGHWPLLSPYSWVCSNLAGEFQYGTFSVFVNAAVILIWKFPLTFAQQAAALSITQLFALAMGAYLLARARNLSAPSSLMVALVAALNGWMICWGASDWFGAVAAFAWLPWSWWAMEKAVPRDGPRWRVLLPAPFIYLLVTGGFPYTIGMLALVTVWLGLRSLVTEHDWRASLRLTSGWLLGLGLSAPAWMSLLEYTPGSRRSVERFIPNQWLVPFKALPGFVVPSWTVNWHQFEAKIGPHHAVELACGLAPIVILIAVACTIPKRLVSKLRWELGLLALVLILCLLPTPGIFRFSFRWLPLFHLVLALSAAEAYRLWQGEVVRQQSWWQANAGAWAVLLTGLTWTAMSIFGLTTPKDLANVAPVFFLCAIVWWIGASFFGSRGKLWLLPIVTFATLLTTYLRLDPHAPLAHYFFTETLKSPAPLNPERLYLSLYPEPQSWYRADMTGVPFGNVVRPGSTSMFGAVHLVNGYSPVGPAGVARLFDSGTHGHLNPGKVDDVVMPATLPGALLEKLGIDGIIVARDFQLPAQLPNEWKLVHSEAEGDVYERAVAIPAIRAFADDRYSNATVQIIENSRHKVLVDVSPIDNMRPVLITVSRPYLPGYHAKWEGVELPVKSFQGLTPAVELPAGQSGRLELLYRPRVVVLGGIVTAITGIVLVLLWWQYSIRSPDPLP
ncbi:MAG: hypothetical protein M3128_04570 [Verrucomicrobiota bacterium]|nr:hypothetical protein [Verrucomicrobiota bacterium]